MADQLAALDQSGAPEGMRVTWVPAPSTGTRSWEIVAPDDLPRRCRWTDSGVRCEASSVARLCRGLRDGSHMWWHYCADHLYGRVLVDGVIYERQLVNDEAP